MYNCVFFYFSGEQEGTNAADEMISESCTAYDSGGYSPKYMTQSQLEPGTIVTLDEDDARRLEYARHQVLRTGGKVQSAMTSEEQAMDREARKNMGTDEAQFSVESSLEAQIYLWSDKYRPRKPRYFNRVHTGFEWNKYNQTHYDMDNPPPKIVQGYKFNIFYPDLIDKGTTPEYFLVKYHLDTLKDVIFQALFDELSEFLKFILDYCYETQFHLY